MATVEKFSGVEPKMSGQRGLIKRPGSGQGTHQLLRRLLFSEYFILYISIAYFLILAIFKPALYQPANLSNMLANAWPLFAIATGQTFVLLIGGIDLSQTSVMAMTSVAGAVVMVESASATVLERSPLWGHLLTEEGGILAGSSFAVAAAVMVMLLIGMFIGLLNGLAVARFNMPAFMVTLVSMTFFSAVAIYLTQSENIRGIPETFLKMGNGDMISLYVGEKASKITRRDILSFITYPALLSMALGFVGHIVLTRTVLGRQIYAVGANRAAAAVSGVPVKRVIILVFMISGFCAAVASILYTARLEAGRPTLGENLLLDVVGAAVIGGTSLFGGKGKIHWTFMGVLFFVLLSNSLNLLNLSAFYIDMVKGAIILLAALTDVTRTRLLAREA
ncbi:ABC transporter permease [Aggregatilinea lenta]|uniref:ABC transporter permease n=1 Tax=Aggregatilinea lenta TaxID=913108 RepID=UPI000E5ABCF0|nr:ABC transporter permease [Aggregatilinea lenta]